MPADRRAKTDRMHFPEGTDQEFCYLGRGPQENYNDRCSGAFPGISVSKTFPAIGS